MSNLKSNCKNEIILTKFQPKEVKKAKKKKVQKLPLCWPFVDPVPSPSEIKALDMEEKRKLITSKRGPNRLDRYLMDATANYKKFIEGKLPNMSKSQVVNYQQGFIENLLQDLLVNGFHDVFEELFDLILNDVSYSKTAQEYFVSTGVMPLYYQHDTIEFIAKHLKEAESAKQMENYAQLFECHLNLAKKFVEKKHHLASRFFAMCLRDATEYHIDSSGRALAEINYEMGLHAEENGDLDTAFEHMNTYYNLMEGTKLTKRDQPNKSMFSDACHQLFRICLALGKSRLSFGLPLDCLNYYNKAYKIAMRDGDKGLISEALQSMGKIYSIMGDNKESQKYFQKFLEISEEIGDWVKISNAYKNLGSIYVKMDNLSEAKEHYTKFVETSEKCKDEETLISSYLHTGLALNNAGDYQNAIAYLSKAFQMILTSTSLKKDYSKNCRVRYGLALAHKMLPEINNKILFTNYAEFENLLDWKELRIPLKEPIPDNLKGLRRETRLARFRYFWNLK